MQILTVTPKGNKIVVDLIRKGHNRVTGDVFSDNQYGVQFASVKSDEQLMDIIKGAVKLCRVNSQPVKIDLETQSSEFLQNKATAPSKSFVEEKKAWERRQQIGFPITKEKAFDNLFNEGEEGYNPYRNA